MTALDGRAVLRAKLGPVVVILMGCGGAQAGGAPDASIAAAGAGGAPPGADDAGARAGGAGAGAGGERDAGSPEAGSDAGPQDAIAVLTRVCGPQDCVHYLNAFAELPPDGAIDRSRGVELGNVEGEVFGDAIFIFDRDSSTVTRWSVGEDLVPREGPTMSFLNAGVIDACAACNAFSSDRLAYTIDSSAGVLVTWNPTDMEILATQDIPDALLARDGKPATFAWPLVSGGRAYFTLSWTDPDTFEVDAFEAWSNAAVATFDASVEEPLVSVLEDSRCGVSSAVTPFPGDAGDVFIVGDWLSGLLQIGAAVPAPNPACLLRLAPGATELDPEYYVDLLAAADARAIYRGYGMAGGRLLLNYWPTSEPAPTPQQIDADPFVYFSGTGFRYGVLDLSSGDFAPVTAIAAAGPASSGPLSLDGVTLIQAYPDGDPTTGVGTDLFAVGADGSVARVLAAGTAGEFAMIGRLPRRR